MFGSEFLGHLADGFTIIGVWFYDVGNGIGEVPVIGGILSTPFIKVGDRFFIASNKTYEFRWKYEQLAGWAQSLIDKWGFSDLLTSIWEGWWYLRDDPLGWVNAKIEGLWPDWYWFRQDPLWWIEYQFRDRFPWLGGFLDDPSGTIAAVIADRHPLLSAIIHDGWMGFKEAMYMLHSDLSPIFDDPLEWLRFRIAALLNVDYSFWYDPYGYIKEIVIAYRNDWIVNSRDWLYEIGEKLGRHFWEGVW